LVKKGERRENSAWEKDIRNARRGRMTRGVGGFWGFKGKCLPKRGRKLGQGEADEVGGGIGRHEKAAPALGVDKALREKLGA